MKFSTMNLRSKILLPIGLALAIFCFGGFLVAHFIQRDHINDMITTRIRNTGNLFDTILGVEADAMQALAEAYTDRGTFRTAFLAGDREELFRRAQETFADIRAKYHITHFYFHLADNRCFLRVHNPPRHSDQIDRQTLRKASSTYAPSRGLELGPLGTLTMRVVVPWLIEERLVGFIELGKEIDHIVPSMKRLQDVDLIIAISKKFLDRGQWEEGLRVMDKTATWDDYPEHVIAGSTLAEIPDDLHRVMANHERDHSRKLFDLLCDDCRYRVGAIPVWDAGGTEVGDMFILRDLDEFSYGQKAFIFIMVVSVSIIVVFYLLFSIYLSNITDSIRTNQAELEQEVREHEATERQLEEKSRQLDELLRRKSDELEEAVAEVKILSGFLPICASCKSIRKEDGNWEQIESYIRDHSEAEFSHSYCPKCAQQLYREYRKP